MQHLMTHAAAMHAGAGEGGAGGVDRARREADQQLVHQPEETALEAVRGHAFRDDGRLPPTERSCAVHGRPVHGRWHVPPRFMSSRGLDYPTIGPSKCFCVPGRMRCNARTLLWNFCYRLPLIAKGGRSVAVARSSVYGL